MYFTRARTMTRKPERVSIRRRDEFFFILIFVILCFVRTLEAAPLETSEKFTRHEDTLVSGLPSKKGHDEEVGNPSELAWQAWLLVDGAGQTPNSQSSGVLDSASLLRRITPKSIFIAPALTACAEGYQADTMNRCVKDVSIDRQAHFGFLVERLNAMYANVGKPQFSQSSSSSQPTGPLQLNIPLLMPVPPKSIPEVPKLSPNDKQENNGESTLSTEKKSIISQNEYSQLENVSHDRDAIVTVYELNEESKVRPSFFGNESTVIVDENSKITSTKLVNDEKIVVPVAEFVEDSTANISDIVDYKIPTVMEKIFQSKNASDNNDKYENDDEQVSPTLVLLLSPTKLPASKLSVSSDLVVAHNSSLGQIIVKMENITENITGKEIIRVSVPDPPSLSSESNTTRNRLDNVEISGTNTKNHESNVTFGEKNENLPTEDYDKRINDHESTEIYDETVNDENYEESTELYDEILTHSEAGMTINLSSLNDRSTVKPLTMEFQSVEKSSDKEQTGSSKISSEVSINDDFVRETTLVDFNASELTNSPLSTSFAPSSNENDEQTTTAASVGSKELYLPDIGVVTLANLRNEKRDGHLSNVKGFVGDLDAERIHEENTKIENIEREDNFNKNSHVKSNANENSDVDSGLKNNSNIDSSSEKNSHLNASPKENPVEKISEPINPVRGIEEAFEDFLPSDLPSSVRAESGETMMAASTNNAGTISSEMLKFNIDNDKRIDRPFRFPDETTTIKSPLLLFPDTLNHEKIYDYDTVSRDYPDNRENPVGIRGNDAPPMIRTTDENYRQKENVHSSRRQNNDKFLPSQRNDDDYVRFPNYSEIRDETRVRFPYDEANSITNDYKERNQRPNQREEIYTGAVNRESFRVDTPDIHQKESYWWLPNGWRNDKQQQGETSQQKSRASTTNEQRPRDRGPMLLRFWTRMPLVRDPSFIYPTRPSSIDGRRSYDSRNRARLSSRVVPSRRVNYYKEMSNHDISRALARNKPPTVG